MPNKRKMVTVTCVDCKKERKVDAYRVPERCKACAIKIAGRWRLK